MYISTIHIHQCYRLAAFHCYGHHLEKLFLFRMDDVAEMDGNTFIPCFVKDNTDVPNTVIASLITF